MNKGKGMREDKIKLIYLFVIGIVLSMIIGIVFSFVVTTLYRDKVLEDNARMIGYISLEYPELETGITKALLDNNDEYISEGKNTLKKYGIDLNVKSIDDINFNISIISISIFMCLLFIYVSIVIIYMSKQNKRIKEVTEYTNKIVQNDYSMDIRDNNEDELSILKNSIYDMTVMLKEKNETLDIDKKETEKLLSDMSHQLKTPLTSLNIINDLLYEELPKTKKEEFLDNMRRELTKIEWFIKTLLNLAKLDSKTLKLKAEDVELYNMLNECKNNFNIICELKNTNIDIVNKEKVICICDKSWTQEAINNLIKNAIEHGSHNIRLSYSDNKIYTQIKIEDDGDGISKEDVGHIFDRFYKSKNSSKDSIGIGLAFVKSIITNQAGDIRVSSKLGKGTVFTIKLYKMNI